MKFSFNWRKLLIILLLILIVYPTFFIFFPEHLMHMHISRNWIETLISMAIDVVWLVAAIWIIWNQNNKFISYLEGKIRWEYHPFKRLIYQVSGTALMDIAIISICGMIGVLVTWFLYPRIGKSFHDFETQNLLLQFLFYFGTVFTLFHFTHLSVIFYCRWVRSLVESERLKNENVHAQLHALQNQVNPHFLFNSLNTLTSVIEEDKSTAIEYVQQLSNFYRYLLQRQSSHLVPIPEEIGFLSSYIYLQKKRFGDNLRVDLNLEKEIVKKTVPTFVLQLLLENAIKHNIVSSEKPLDVKVYSIDGSKIAVENNLQKKQFSGPSTENGLQNIQNRYEILGDKQIEIIKDEKIFKVIIPLFDERS